jgi:hypothetical protein
MVNMRTARRQWIRSADTDGAFFINTAELARQHGLLASPGTVSPSSNGSLNPADSAKHAAMLAAGSSEAEIISAAAAPSSSSNGTHAVLAGLGSPGRIAAALSSADAEMQAHIAAQSLSINLGSHSANGNGSSTGSSMGRSAAQHGSSSDAALSQKALAKFLRDFEALPVPAEDMLWGLQGGVHR